MTIEWSLMASLMTSCAARSLRMSGDFMITGDNGAQDALLDSALAAGAALKIRVHGRMLGGGGGGNVLLFVDTSDAALRQRWEAGEHFDRERFDHAFDGRRLRLRVHLSAP
jgi:galactokinase/mevalonate kinase-like predicted kinase